MGISPSSYDIFNQRFVDMNDLKIYKNVVGLGRNGVQRAATEFTRNNGDMTALNTDGMTIKDA
jgi:hypothetical protein